MKNNQLDVIQVTECFLNGLTNVSRLAEKFNTSKYFIKKILEENNINVQKIIAQENTKLEQEIIKYYTSPQTFCNTLKHFNISQNKLNNILAKYHIDKHTNEQIKEICKQNNLEKYGTEWYCQSDSFKEKSKITCNIKYNTDYASQADVIKNKVKQTCLEKYEATCYLGSEQGKTKIKQHFLDTYGVESILLIPEFQQTLQEIIIQNHGGLGAGASDIAEKMKQTCLERYGAENVLASHEIREKIKQTIIEKYGVENAMQAQEIIEKAKQTWQEKYKGIGFASDIINKKIKKTCKELYNDENYTNREKCSETKATKYNNEHYNNREKAKLTCLEKFGTENPMQNKEIFCKSLKKYSYNDIYFDSSWELALWIYANDHNEPIIREPVQLQYYIDNKLYFYFPDFLYKNILIEIKGDHMLTADKKLFNPYSQDQTKAQAKQQCIELNNVCVWNKADVQFAIDYIIDTYGKNYLKQFRNN